MTLILPGVGIADCRTFPGVADMVEGYMGIRAELAACHDRGGDSDQ
jgi:hypothetical protein